MGVSVSAPLGGSAAATAARQRREFSECTWAVVPAYRYYIAISSFIKNLIVATITAVSCQENISVPYLLASMGRANVDLLDDNGRTPLQALLVSPMRTRTLDMQVKFSEVSLLLSFSILTYSVLLLLLLVLLGSPRGCW